MVIYIGADHRGFELKEKVKTFLKSRGYQIVDLGNNHFDEGDDYPVFGAKVAGKVSAEFETARGILICGTGVGMSVVANKFPRIRAVLAYVPDQAFDSRKEDNSNILALGADYLDEESANRIVLAWLETPFAEEERYNRRLSEIDQIEQERITDGGNKSSMQGINWQ